MMFVLNCQLNASVWKTLYIPRRKTNLRCVTKSLRTVGNDTERADLPVAGMKALYLSII